ncbi:hypothetical protein XELAEV_18034332mg [Xenopus laevis]|uniref:Uncharacterized protein n=1 Tax=Xenopus laevis TaxID=8355 RepID=A0A974CEB7_XENLA|nr:hypothetical protein XELAEV_18034332mg [Xenopus laevis]
MEDEQELFRLLTPAPFRRQCWMENVDPAWNPLDYSTDIASIPVCYQADDYIEVISLDDTESEEIEIEILRPITPASCRRHRWMENEDLAWNVLVSSSNVASIQVFYDDDIEVIVLDDREWIEEEKEIIRPITLAFRRQCWIENEDPAWSTLVSFVFGKNDNRIISMRIE